MFYSIVLGCLIVLLVHAVRGGEGASAARGSLTVEEARSILGVSPDADEESIRDAYRRLMQKNHPDQGGSEYLARQINQAKDVLLGK